MTYRKELEACSEPGVGAAVFAAVEELFAKEHNLLVKAPHERTIAAKLAEYLRPHFPDYDVNFEYNKMGDVPKRLLWRPDRRTPSLVYPDVIVHRIGERVNLLVIELKLDSNDTSKEDDVLKLMAFGEDPDFHYEHALFMRFGVGDDGAGSVSECEWVIA